MAPVSIMTVIEKSNGIVTDHRCKIIIENPPAVIWHTYMHSCPSLSIQAWTIAEITSMCGTFIPSLSEQVK
jgi:hypothetical protein